MNEKKESSWEKVKSETENVKKLWNRIPMDNIDEINEVIYAAVKLVNDEIGIPQKKKKPACEISLEWQLKKLRQWVKLLRKLKHTKTEWNKKKQQQKYNCWQVWQNKR